MGKKKFKILKNSQNRSKQLELGNNVASRQPAPLKPSQASLMDSAYHFYS